MRRSDGAYFTRGELAETVERQAVEIARLKAQNAALVAQLEPHATAIDYSAVEAPADEP